MEEVLISYVVDYEKSSYRIELIEDSKGRRYVSLEQSIYHDTSEFRSLLKIRPAALDQIIEALIKTQATVKSNADARNKKRKKFSDENTKELIYRYLNKNLTLEVLAIQYNCSVNDVRDLLFEENIAIVSNKLSDYKPAKRYWRKKRKGQKDH